MLFAILKFGDTIVNDFKIHLIRPLANEPSVTRSDCSNDRLNKLAHFCDVVLYNVSILFFLNLCSIHEPKSAVVRLTHSTEDNFQCVSV